MTLRAIVIGAGFAGEGHTIALRAAGVDVVAMCGRTPEPAKAMAEKLGIKEIRFDWRQALTDLRPDIVSIATPGAPHCEMAEVAAQLGCHVMCDKPLAINASEARDMLLAVEQAGVKHAYGTTSRYQPTFAYIETLLTRGQIGRVREIEYLMHLNTSPLAPYYEWYHQLSQGGGWLFTAFTHQLDQVLRMTVGQVVAAAGEARRLIDRAPIGPTTLHDWRDHWGAKIDPEQAEAGEWGEVDVDQAYTVMAQLQMPDHHTASVLIQSSSMVKKPEPNAIAFYGTEGTLYLSGGFWGHERIQHYDQAREVWQDMPVPQAVIDALPQGEGWNHLFREFVADIRGEGNAGYPTFRDGWVANEIIDIVRSGQSWRALPTNPAID